MSRVKILLFAAPAVILLFLPLLCLAVWYWFQDREFSVYLLAVLISWVEIPAMIFGKPFFDSEMVGYSPHGLLGWVVIVLFWLAVSLAISFSLRCLTRFTQRRRHI